MSSLEIMMKKIRAHWTQVLKIPWIFPKVPEFWPKKTLLDFYLFCQISENEIIRVI
jgi:hypothetical protein